MLYLPSYCRLKEFIFYIREDQLFIMTSRRLYLCIHIYHVIHLIIKLKIINLIQPCFHCFTQLIWTLCSFWYICIPRMACSRSNQHGMSINQTMIISYAFHCALCVGYLQCINLCPLQIRLGYYQYRFINSANANTMTNISAQITLRITVITQFLCVLKQIIDL